MFPGDRKSQRRLSGAGENDYLVKGEIELEVLINFMMNKFADVNKDVTKTATDNDKKPITDSLSDVDAVFKAALEKYHRNLMVTCSETVLNVSSTLFLEVFMVVY